MKYEFSFVLPQDVGAFKAIIPQTMDRRKLSES
jgi:hypothetical protein